MADPVVASRFVLLDSVIGGAAAGLVVAVAVGFFGWMRHRFRRLRQWAALRRVINQSYVDYTRVPEIDRHGPALREAAYGLGATRFEVATQVVVPAALSGIVASAVLALSRAVGETMIVSIAAGQNPTFTLDPRVPIETMTAYIVQVSLGDTPFASLEYRTIFAVGTMLFFLTFAMNIFAHWFVRRFREEYD